MLWRVDWSRPGRLMDCCRRGLLDDGLHGWLNSAAGKHISGTVALSHLSTQHGVKASKRTIEGKKATADEGTVRSSGIVSSVGRTSGPADASWSQMCMLLGAPLGLPLLWRQLGTQVSATASTSETPQQEGALH